MEKSIKSEKNKSYDFPEDVIVEILCRLPVKSVLRCTSVCKSWYFLIKTSNFISSHLQRTTLLSSSNNSINRNFILITWNLPFHYSLHLDNKDFEKYKSLQNPFDGNYCHRIAGSCNGLICVFCTVLQIYGLRVILWNPLISKFLPIPKSIWENACTHYENFMGFGFDSRTKDYKVLRILNLNADFRAELYSLNMNSWKDITQICPKNDVKQFDSAFVKGAMHWIVTDRNSNQKPRNLIMVFNVSDEVFDEILLPEILENASNLTVKVYGESSIGVINAVSDYESDIWVMKEYGIVTSWVKSKVGKQWRGKSFVLGFRNNGEALIEFGCNCRRLNSQKLNSKHVEHLRPLPFISKGIHPSLHNYVDSLVLLNKGNEEGGANDPSTNCCP